jgi:GAF domain-containing protein
MGERRESPGPLHRTRPLTGETMAVRPSAGPLAAALAATGNRPAPPSNTALMSIRINGLRKPPECMRLGIGRQNSRPPRFPFEAAAASIALTDTTTGELVYQSAWGAGAREIVGVRLPPGTGIGGSVARGGQPEAVGDCRSDERFAARIAAGTGYVPYTMLVVPLMRVDRPVGALTLLDRRDGRPYGPGDVERASLFADLAVQALGLEPEEFTGLGTRRAPPSGFRPA